MIISKVTENQGFILPVEDIFLEKTQRRVKLISTLPSPPSYLRVDFTLFDTQLTLFFLINGQTLRMLFIRTDVLALKEVPIVKIILRHIPTSQ